MKEHIQRVFPSELAALDSYRGHGHLHLHSSETGKRNEAPLGIAEVRLPDGSCLVPYDVAGTALVAELPLFSFLGVVAIPALSHDMWKQKLTEKQGEQKVSALYTQRFRGQEQVLFLVDRRGERTLARSWRKHPDLAQGTYWGERKLADKTIFEPVILMKAIDFLQREEANPEPLQVLTAAFRKEPHAGESQKGTLASAGCDIHDDSTKTLNTNLLIRSLAFEEMKVITAGSQVDYVYIHLQSRSPSQIIPESLATQALLATVSDRELIALSFDNVATMMSSRNVAQLGKPLSSERVLEGLYTAVPRILEIAGNGGSIAQAKEVVSDHTVQRK